MDYTVIGTAGHIDHGKTMLVKALTGTDTDRLKEEKERGISIELGFASMTLPGGSVIAFVDVPGHEKFIRQMLAGVGGVDAVMLTVAADEGVKPQTKEHLEILDLLGVSRGLVALTKSDLVNQMRVGEVEKEVRKALEGKSLASAPIVPVSAVTSEGLDTLTQELARVQAATGPRSSSGKVRMPVDRVFSLKGVGTVVTGTLWSGVIRPEMMLEIAPAGLKCRVRGIQAHGEAVAEIPAGRRAAVNLAGVDKESISRGSMLQEPGYVVSSSRLDLLLKYLPSAGRNLANRQRIRFYHGTAEVLGRILLLDRDELEPGGRAFVQVILEGEVAARAGDRYIIRSYSPVRTTGGGTVVNSEAPARKRFDEKSLARVAVLYGGAPEEKLEVFLEETGERDLNPEKMAEIMGVAPEQVADLTAGSARLKELLAGGSRFVLSRNEYLSAAAAAQDAVSDYHHRYPLRTGMPKEELRSAVFKDFGQKEYEAILNELTEEKKLVCSGDAVMLPDFELRPNPKQQQKIAAIEERLLANPFQPLLWSLISKDLFHFDAREGEELRRHLMRTGKMVRVADDLYFHREALIRAQEAIKRHIEEHGSISVASARDLLGSSRKFVVPLMEYLDAQGFTRREGDGRVLAG